MSVEGIVVVDRTWFSPRYRHTLPFVFTQLVLFGLIFSAYPMPLLLSYPWYRLLHFLGAILLIGSAINASIRETFTLSIRSRAFTYYVYKWAGFADLFLFYPGAFLIAVAGASMTTSQYGNVYATNWLFAANVSFLLSFLSYALLSYAQFRVAARMRSDRTAVEFSREEAEFLRRSLRKEWTLNALCSVFTMVPIVLMVFKPKLDSLTAWRLMVASAVGAS